MNDDAKIERQLRMEVAALRQRVAELERAAPQRQSSGKSLPSSSDSPGPDPSDRAVELLRAKSPQWIEGSRDGYALMEMTGAFLYGNAAYCTMLGYSLEELRQLTHRDITPEKWFTLDQLHFDEMEAQGYCALYEKEYRRRDGTVFPVEIRSYLDRDDKGNTLGMWSIVRDITERRRAEESIRLQARMLDRIGQAVIATDPAGKIIYANPFAHRLYGWASAEMMGHDILEATVPQTTREQAAEILACLQKGDSWSGEFVVQRRDGSTFPASVTDTPVLDDQGRLATIIGVSKDITSEKNNELALRRSESNLARAQQIAQLGSWEVDLAEGVLTWSDQVFRIFGVERSQFAGTEEAFFALVHPEDRESLLAARAAWLENGGEFDEVHRIVRPDGEVRWVRELAQVFKDADGTPLFTSGTVQDITRSKNAEAELQSSEQRFRGVVETAAEAIFIQTRGRFAYANPAALNLFGANAPSDLIGRPVLDQFHPDSRPGVRERIRLLNENRREVPLVEEVCLKLDGQPVHVEVVATPFEHEGELGALVFARDLTEYRRVETALRVSEERLRLAQKATNDVIWDWDIIRDSQRWNEAGAVVFGWKEIVDHPQTAAWWVERVHPQDLQRVKQGFYAVTDDPAKDRWTDEYRFRKADGSYAQVVDRGHVLRDAQGRAVRMIGAMHDITERKRAEQLLRLHQERLQRTQAVGHVGSWEFDPQSGKIWGSDEGFRIFGLPYANEEVPIEEVEACIPDRARVNQALVDLINQGTPYNLDYEVRPADGGAPRVVYSIGELLRDAQGKPLKVIGVVQDITERKQAEQEIRAAHQRLTYHVENSPLAVVEWDRDFRVQRWSEQAEALFGWSPEEVIGKFPTEWRFVHPDDQPAVEQIMGGLLQGNQPRNLSSNRNFTKDGRVVHCEWYNSAMVGPDGRLLSILSLVHDITERKQAEAVVQQSQQQLRALSARLETLREEERTRISREIHDELGQMLTGVKIDLRWMERRVSQMSDTALQNQMGDKISGMKGLVDDTIKSVQRIAAELRPGTLDRQYVSI